MFIFLQHRSTQALPRFNCSGYDVSELEAQYRSPIWGSLSFAYGILMQVLYVPSLMTIRLSDCYHFSCYKIMFFLGIVEMGALLLNSVITGILLFNGSVFCSSPDLIYATGSFGLGCWEASCMLCFILVVNRLLDIVDTQKILISFFFKGIRTNILILLACIYGYSMSFFNDPPLFSSVYGAWFLDPFIPGKESSQYTNRCFFINNVFVVTTTCACYGIFCIVVANRVKQTNPTESYSNKIYIDRNKIFVQCTIICIANFGASLLYVIIQIVPVTPVMVLVGHISWQLGDGIPAIIYMFINTTIRREMGKIIDMTNLNIPLWRSQVQSQSSQQKWFSRVTTY